MMMMIDNRRIVFFGWKSRPPLHKVLTKTRNDHQSTIRLLRSSSEFVPSNSLSSSLRLRTPKDQHLFDSRNYIYSGRYHFSTWHSPKLDLFNVNRVDLRQLLCCLSACHKLLLVQMAHTDSGGSSNLKTARQRSSDDEDKSDVKKQKTEPKNAPMGNIGTAKSKQETAANQKDGDLGRPSEKEKLKSKREQLMCRRQWEITKKGKLFYSSYDDLSQTVYEFSIASYNVLAQNLLVENSYLYRNCDAKYLQWNIRKELLLAELRKHNPDILCLQEVNEDHYADFFLPQLFKLGYRGYYKKRTGKRRDGCATFYKIEKFDCRLIYPVEYLMPEVPLLDRDNVALVLLLQPKRCNHSIDAAVCIANTHLLFNPRRGDIKLAQLMRLFAEIDKLVYKRSSSPADLDYHPVVVCGDFNLEPFSDLYNFVRSGSLMCDGTVIRKLSGQESDSSGGSNRCLDSGFLSTAAGITDQCQFLDMAVARYDRHSQMSLSPGLDPSESPPAPMRLSQGSGTITHRLGLRSVYEHARRPQGSDEDEVEATTFHGNANCTVDYIFYSSAGKRTKPTTRGSVVHSGGSHLELMSRLKLLSTREMETVGELPNDLNASDHTILMAKFSFKL